MEYRRLPSRVKEAFVKVCGKSFWLKEPLFNIFRESGVSEELIIQFQEESKFKFARHILSKLESMGEEGWLVQKRLITNMCNLRKPVEDKSNLQDWHGAIDSLRDLKDTALKETIVVRNEKLKSNNRNNNAEEIVRVKSLRSQKMAELLKMYNELLINGHKQSRGYSLEDMLVEIFTLYEIEYKRPYKIETEQIDGHFHFDGFDYIVEARWRENIPTSQEIGGFKSKVDKKIDSTRGLFVSIKGFRKEVINEYEGEGSKIIFVDGQDLTYILEERYTLHDALRKKITKASQEGILFYPLYEE